MTAAQLGVHGARHVYASPEPATTIDDVLAALDALEIRAGDRVTLIVDRPRPYPFVRGLRSRDGEDAEDRADAMYGGRRQRITAENGEGRR